MATKTIDGQPRLNWTRGLFRVWIIVSLLWVALVIWYSVSAKNVTWLPSRQMVHVKISDTEQWDYPADLGETKIKADLEKRMAVLDEEDRVWAEKLPQSRKDACKALPSNMKFADYPPPLRDDCARLVLVGSQHGWWPGWESQLENPPSIWMERSRC